MANEKESAAMIAAAQLAVRIDEANGSDKSGRSDEEIRLSLLTHYQACYEAIIAIHKTKAKAGTWDTESNIPPSGGKRTFR